MRTLVIRPLQGYGNTASLSYPDTWVKKPDCLHFLYKDKFLETYNLPKLNQEEAENLNRQITTTEIEAVIKKLPKNKSPSWYILTGELYLTSKEKLTPILLKLFQKIQEEGRLPCSFYEATTKKIIGQYL